MLSRNDEYKIFTVFSKFVSQLNVLFDTHNHLNNDLFVKLALYNRLLEKTNSTHTGPINKHLTLFTEWVNHNLDACCACDTTLLNGEHNTIVYSDNVQLPLNTLLQLLNERGDNESVSLAWKNILYIGFQLTNNESLKQKINEFRNNNNNDNNNNDKIEQIIDKTFDEIKSEFEKMKNVNSAKEVVIEMAKNGSFEKILDGLVTTLEQYNVDPTIIMSKLLKKTGVINPNQDLSGLGSILSMMGGGGSASDGGEEESKMFEESENGFKQLTN